MTNQRSPLSLLAAISRIEKEITNISEPDGQQSSELEFVDMVSTLHNDQKIKSSRVLAAKIFEMLYINYDTTGKRLTLELEIQDAIRGEINDNLQLIINQLNIDKSSVDILLSASQYSTKWTIENANELLKNDDTDPGNLLSRSVRIGEGGLSGGKSIKFRNIHLDIGEMSSLASGAIIAGYEMLEKRHILVIVAGVLLTISLLTKIMTVELSEQDASVFWGFICLRDKNGICDAKKLLETTNRERISFGLEPLSELQFTYSLKKLEKIRSVKKEKNNQWRIIEKHKIID
jgi:hypothetical protein